MSDHQTQALVSTSSIVSGVVVGLVHAGIAVLLWNYWFDNLWEMLTIKPLNGLYIGLGMFFLGFVPTMFYVGQKVISPVIIVTTLLILTGFGSWLGGSVVAPSANPTPFGLYILFWIGIVVLVGITGRWEYRHKQRATG